MENAKQKAIRLAWINLIGQENYENNVSLINENGWFNRTSLKYKDCLFLFNENRHHLETNFRGLFRPKSLQGIETNNNWVCIESEEDLPSEYGKYWIIDKDNGKMYQREFDKSTKGFFLEYSTRYQPIVKPLKPIY